jgi:hypothetical protein
MPVSTSDTGSTPPGRFGVVRAKRARHSDPRRAGLGVTVRVIGRGRTRRRVRQAGPDGRGRGWRNGCSQSNAVRSVDISPTATHPLIRQCQMEACFFARSRRTVRVVSDHFGDAFSLRRRFVMLHCRYHHASRPVAPGRVHRHRRTRRPAGRHRRAGSPTSQPRGPVPRMRPTRTRAVPRPLKPFARRLTNAARIDSHR